MLALSMEGTTTYPAGKRHVVSIAFTAAEGDTTTTTSLTFGNSPIQQQVSDSTGGELETAWVGGTITISPAVYTISGSVKTDTGEPIPGVNVSTDGAKTTTDAEGRYTLRELPAGTYTVRCCKSGYSFTPVSRVVTVGPHQENIDFTGAPITVEFTAASQTSTEEKGTMVVTAQLSAATCDNTAVTVPFTVSGSATKDVDYSITASPLTIPAGQTEGTITITIKEDTIDEPDETVIVTMGEPTNATKGTTTVHTATIKDDDAAPSVQFIWSTQSSKEEKGSLVVTARLSTVSAQAVRVPFTVSGTATKDVDYSITASPITIPAGQTTGTITITIKEDILDEPDETVIVTMDEPENATKGATSVHTATIKDDDPTPTVQFNWTSQGSKEEENTLVVPVQLSAPSSWDVTVPFAVSGTATRDVDYTVTDSPIVIPAGETMGEITVNIIEDTVSEVDETIILTIGEPTNAIKGANNTHTITIVATLTDLSLDTPQTLSLVSNERTWYRFVLPEAVPAPKNLFFSLHTHCSGWECSVSVGHAERVLSTGVGSDILLHIADPQPGEYLAEIIPHSTGEVTVRVGTSLPVVEAGRLFVGTIYHQDGFDWAQIEVPEGTGVLRLRVDAPGNTTDLNLWHNCLDCSPEWQETGTSPLRLEIPEPSRGTYYIRISDHGALTGGCARDYSIIATLGEGSTVIDNTTIRAVVNGDKASVTSLVFKSGSKKELINGNLMHLGTDPVVGVALSGDWHKEESSIGTSNALLRFSHAGGFAKTLFLSWSDSKVEVRTEITSPNHLILDNNVLPGGNTWGSDDQRAVPMPEGVQVGNSIYPAGEELATPAENWMAFWDRAANEVYGFTFSPGCKVQAARSSTTPARLWVPAGQSILTFYVVKPKPVQPYDAIRSLTTAPRLTLTKTVDVLFAGRESTLTYTISFGNTGSSQATGVTLVDTLPTELSYVENSASDGGVYDSTLRTITWNLGSLDVGVTGRTVTFKAKINEGVPNGTRITNSARIFCGEAAYPVSAEVTTQVASPKITSISPTSGGNTGSVTITINGENLDPNATVKLTAEGQPDIVASSVSGTTDGAQLFARFGLLGQPAGARAVVVTDAEGHAISRDSAFTVTSGGQTRLWVEVVCRNQIRSGREQTIMLRYGNSGSVDAHDVLVYLKVSPGVQWWTAVPLTSSHLSPQPGESSSLPSTDTYVPFLIERVRAGASDDLSIAIKTNQDQDVLLEAGIAPVTALVGEQGTVVPTQSPAIGTAPIHSRKSTGNPRVAETAWYDGARSGDLCFRLSRNGGTGHVGIFHVDEWGSPWVIDLGVSGEVRKPTPAYLWAFEERPLWDNGWGGYARPIGMTEEMGANIASFALSEVGKKYQYRIPPLHSAGEEDCLSWATDMYARAGYPVFWKDWYSPGGLYEFIWEVNGEAKAWPEQNRFWRFVGSEQLMVTLDVLNDDLKGGVVGAAYFVSRLLTVVRSRDPNDKAGPSGFDPENTAAESRKRHASTERAWPYIIFFENKPEATAATQEVVVTDQLDSNLDWNTFSFGTIQVGGKTLNLPSDSKNITKDWDLRPETNAILKVKATFDTSTGRARWELKGTDPFTGELADFLPPNTTPPVGEGSVSYTVQPKKDLATGTVIKNKATIVFDVNPPMDTPEVFNTIDSGAPTSSVQVVHRKVNKIDLSWGGSDDENGSGIRDYTIYVAEKPRDGGPYQYKPWLTNTTETKGTYEGQVGKTYAFYSIARDNVGNEEAAPAQPDVEVTTSNPETTLDAGWHIFSTPLNPNPCEISAQLQDDVGNPFLYTWDKDHYTLANCLSAGRGGWLLVYPDKSTIDVTGDWITGDSFTLNLPAGWSLIGNPYDGEIKWTDCKVRRQGSDSAPVNIGDPSAAELIMPSLFTWDGQRYKPTDNIEAWQGYWALALQDCEVTIPENFAPLLLGRSRRAGGRDAGNWSLEIIAQSDSGSDAVSIAVKPGATRGFDGIRTDQPKPPPSPSGLQAYFERPQWKTRNLRGVTSHFHTDARGKITQRESWEFTVELQGSEARSIFPQSRAARDNEEVTLFWPNLTAVPKDYRLTLVDNQTGARRYMRTTTGYSFTLKPGQAKRFTVVIDPTPGERLRVHVLHSDIIQTRAAQLLYSLTLSAEVAVRVRTLNGRLVAELPVVRGDKGLNRVVWNMEDRLGRVLPRGIYIVEIVATTEEGQQAKGVRTIRVK